MTDMAMVGLIVGFLMAGDPQVPGQAGNGGAVERAKQESAAYVRAFNGRKPKELGETFTSDADLAFLQGADVKTLQYGLISGADRIADCFATFFEVYPDARLSQVVVSARFIRPDLLLADVDFEIVGLPGDAGPIRGRSVVLRVKEADAWKIAADRNVSGTPASK